MRLSLAKTTTFVLLLGAGLVIASTPFSEGDSERPIPYGNIVETFWIFNNLAPISFDGNQEANGTTATFPSICRTYQVSHGSISPPQTFVQWMPNGGTLSSLTANPTTFTPTTGAEAIAMILGSNNQRWAGCVGVNPAGFRFTDVCLDFYVPSSVTYHSGGLHTDWCWGEDLLVWAGIGGDQGSLNLWQAGLDITAYPGYAGCPSGIHFHAFYENTGPQFSSATLDTGWGDTYVHLGDWISVLLHYDRASNTGSDSVCDQSDPGVPCWSVSPGTLPYRPDQSTEEFVAETPGRGGTPPGNVLPTFSAFRMASRSNVFNFPPASPVMQWRAPQTVNGITQTLYPGLINTQGWWYTYLSG